MKKTCRKRQRDWVLKVGCVGAGLLSISSPTRLTAADIGLYDIHNNQSLGSIPNPFPNSHLGLHVAVGDVDDDGLGEIIVGPGEGEAAITVNKAKSADKAFQAMDSYIHGLAAGVHVATGDLDGDGIAELIVTPSTGLSSEAAVLTLNKDKTDNSYVVVPRATSDNLFTGPAGGVRVAVGDVNGDGTPDIIASRGCCGGYIKKLDKFLANGEDLFDPYPGYTGGVQIAVGDVDGDGIAEIITAKDFTVTQDVTVNKAKTADKAFRAFSISNLDAPPGAYIAVGDVNGDGLAELVIGAPVGAEPFAKIYSLSRDLLLDSNSFQATLESSFLAYDAAFRGGVRVAMGDINGDGYADLVTAPASVPEPSTFASCFGALGAFLWGRRSRRRDKKPS